jgi:hypothetical protein
MFIMGQNIYIYHRVRLFKLVFILKSPRFLVKTMFLIATTADVFYGTHKTLVTLVTIPCSILQKPDVSMFKISIFFHPWWLNHVKKMQKNPIDDPAPVAWHSAAGNGQRNAHLTRIPPGVTLGKGHNKVVRMGQRNPINHLKRMLETCWNPINGINWPPVSTGDNRISLAHPPFFWFLTMTWPRTTGWPHSSESDYEF